MVNPRGRRRDRPVVDAHEAVDDRVAFRWMRPFLRDDEGVRSGADA